MLIKHQPDNLFFQDSLTDREIDAQQLNAAISRLEQRNRNMQENRSSS